MTANKGGFDPFAYGQVQLRRDPPADGNNAEDILFAGGGTAPQRESGWDRPPGEADLGQSGAREGPGSLSAETFGTEILGVGPPKRPGVAKKPAAGAAARQGAAAPGGERPPAPWAPGDSNAHAGPEVGKRPQPGAAGLGEPAKEKFAAIAAPRATLPRRHSGPLSLIVPLLTLAFGASGSAWLFLVERDPVTAGLAAVLTCVATAFARVWLRG